MILETTVQDLRFAIRGWRKAPGFALTAIATLALGIGANSAVFSVISGVLLRPLPFANPQNLVEITERQPGNSSSVGSDGPVYSRDFNEFRSSSRLLEGLATYGVSGRNLLGLGDAEQVSVVPAEHDLFQLLGVEAFIGRVFNASDSADVAVISAALWRSHFGRDPSVLGRSLDLDGQRYTLIGVMRDEFGFLIALRLSMSGFRGMPALPSPVLMGVWMR